MPRPSNLAIKDALNIIPSKGKWGLITYINEWVLKVLAYFDIWSPLIDIFDTSSKTHYRIPGSSPAPEEDITEPQTVEDFKITSIMQLKDDSGSIWSEENGQGKGDRWRARIELVEQISSIASRTDPLNRGCHLRFINKQTPDTNGLNKDQIEQRFQSLYPKGWTPIGTKLGENILDPLIYKDADKGILLKRPFLVLVTTDGYSTRDKAGKGGFTGTLDENENEDADQFHKEIYECAMKFENSKENYRKHVVRFSISQIGKNISYVEDEQKVKSFLDGLEYYADIQDPLYRTAVT